MRVAATLTAAEAAAERWDIAVVGAGPAGSWLAGLGAEAGLRVLLVDRSQFPRPKVCGGCLSARTAEQLDEAGIAADLAARGGRRLEGLRLTGWGRAVELRLPPGMVVSRDLLDSTLVRSAVERGAHFLPGRRAILGDVGPRCRRLCLGTGDGPSCGASVVVDATGLGGSLICGSTRPPRQRGRRVGCSAVIRRGDGFEPGVVSMAVGNYGYVGAAVLEDDRLNLAAALDPAAVRRLGAAETARCVLQEAGGPVPDGLPEASWSGTPPLMQRPATRATERLFAVGDAAGYVEPFTGEGIGWALRSATLLAPIAIEGARRWSDELIGAWNALYARELARRQRGCRAIAWLLRHPAAARGALLALQHRPQLGTPFIRRLHGRRIAVAEGARS